MEGLIRAYKRESSSYTVTEEIYGIFQEHWKKGGESLKWVVITHEEGLELPSAAEEVEYTPPPNYMFTCTHVARQQH